MSLRFLKYLFMSMIFLGIDIHRAHAGSINLRITTLVKDIREDLLWVTIEVYNKGDESAFEVEPKMWINGQFITLPGGGQLGAGKTLRTQYRTKTHPFQKKGDYYLPLHITYRAKRGLQFHRHYLIHLVHGKSLPSGLKWDTEDFASSEDTEVKVTLTNIDAWSKIIHFSNSTARYINLQLPDSPYVLQGNTSQTWYLKAEHGSASPNIYQNYLMAEYSREDHHYVQYAPISIKVSSELAAISQLFERRPMIIALVLLLTIAILGGYGPLIYRKLWKKRT